MSAAAIAVDSLRKVYRAGLRLRRVEAVASATFRVEPGEVFGFVGPNGAGKTTTIRALMGLIRPSAGRLEVLGAAVPSRAARERVGFLPESPTFYDYLTARELCELAGELFGQDRALRRRRAGELLDRVGLGGAADRQLRKYSKGMLQRAGLAQALMNDPELVILDEPMSGLDPIGRKEVRDLILELRAAGKTIFFSTHILPDVEAICDRVAIIARGRVLETGAVGKLLDARVLGVDVVVRAAAAALTPLAPPGATVQQIENETTVRLPPGADVNAFLVAVAALGPILEVAPKKELLEDLFVRRLRAEGGAEETR